MRSSKGMRLILAVIIVGLSTVVNCVGSNSTKEFINFYSMLISNSTQFSTTGVSAVRNSTLAYIYETITASEFVNQLFAQFTLAKATSPYNSSDFLQLISKLESNYQTRQIKNYACSTNLDCMAGERCVTIDISVFPAAFPMTQAISDALGSAQLIENLFLMYNKLQIDAFSANRLGFYSLVNLCIARRKEGECPSVYQLSSNSTCSKRCTDDSDCLIGSSKCCPTSCGGSVCVAPITSTTSTCTRWRMQALSVRQSAYVPSCDTDGSFLPQQCTLTNNTCWCVNAHGVLDDSNSCGVNTQVKQQASCPVLIRACALNLWPTCTFVCDCLNVPCAQPCQGFTCPPGQTCSISSSSCDPNNPYPTAACIPVGLCTETPGLALVVDNTTLMIDVQDSSYPSVTQNCDTFIENVSSNVTPRPTNVTCDATVGTITVLCSNNSSECSFCCNNVTIPDLCPAVSVWKWSDVLWNCDASCSALTNQSTTAYSCCYGVCLAMPVSVSTSFSFNNLSTPAWVTTSSALAFSSISLPSRATTSWFTFTNCLYQFELAQLALSSAFNTPLFVPRCDAFGYFEPVQCADSYGLCWCVDRLGNPLTNPVRGVLNCQSSTVASYNPSSNGSVVCPNGAKALSCNSTLCYFARCYAVPKAVCRINPCATSCTVQFFDPITNAPVNCSASAASSCIMQLQAANDSSLPYFATRADPSSRALLLANFSMPPIDASKAFWSALGISLDTPSNAGFVRPQTRPSNQPALCLEVARSCNTSSASTQPHVVGWFADASRNRCVPALLCNAMIPRFVNKFACENACFGTFQLTTAGAVPSCDVYDNYSSVQCDSIGELCWCVSSNGTLPTRNALIRQSNSLICNSSGFVDALSSVPLTCPNGSYPRICDPQVCVAALNRCNVNPFGTVSGTILTCAMDACGDCSPHLIDPFGNEVGSLTCTGLSKLVTGCWSTIPNNGLNLLYQSSASICAVSFNSTNKSCSSLAASSVSNYIVSNSYSSSSSCIFGFNTASQCQANCETYVQCAQSNLSSVQVCPKNPCTTAVCRLFPEAACFPDPCTCQPRFFDPFSFAEVNCNQVASMCQRRRALSTLLARLYSDGLTFDWNATQSAWNFLQSDPYYMCDSKNQFVVPQCNSTTCWCLDTLGNLLANSSVSTLQTTTQSYTAQTFRCVQPQALIVDINFLISGKYYVTLFHTYGHDVAEEISYYFASFLSIETALVTTNYVISNDQSVTVTVQLAVNNQTTNSIDIVSAADLIAMQIDRGIAFNFVNNSIFSLVFSSKVNYLIRKQLDPVVVITGTNNGHIEAWMSSLIGWTVIALAIITSAILSTILILRNNKAERERQRYEAQGYDGLESETF